MRPTPELIVELYKSKSVSQDEAIELFSFVYAFERDRGFMKYSKAYLGNLLDQLHEGAK